MKTPLLLCSALCLAACATASPPVAELAPVPANYAYAERAGAPAPDPQWWRLFNDSALDTLVEQALGANQNIAAGLARVKQARASLRIATAPLLPQASASASTSSDSEGGIDNFSSSARATASYQLDLFGENRAGRKAAKERFKGQIYTQRALELTVEADVANAYFSLNSLRTRLAVAKSNLGISERIYDIVSVRYKAGDVSGFDMASQEASLANARARIPELEQQVASAEMALAVLIGEIPQGYEGPEADILAITPPSIDPGLPGDLLLRRPDLLAAETSLHAADANVAAAIASFFPSIELSGGVAATGLTGGTNVVTSMAASVAETIFSGGRLEGNLQSAKANVEEQIANYRQATLDALVDVDKSLIALKSAESRETQLALAKDAAERSLSLAEVRYKSGADDLTSLLNAQSTYFTASDSLVQGRLDRLTAATSLFTAIGGGWGGADS